MALTGCCLVLFVTFHVLMNAVALIWPAAYNQVCEFLGANWYALWHPPPHPHLYCYHPYSPTPLAFSFL